ncbi:MAG TPA: preprotein translocase subunit SecG [Syntrophales bacterium]|jgi:preprotein translocase subunit SecG|nr:preprotein translocase subunit SecG [Syntrophales bacterium]HON23028.1 preprotein translocase subunit SecG [Syntrophales bacterium]HOU78172.1 preprotein translocase subunit SecG [Syntrophales bacterium]HPC33061.1 preprotein translocase subunit SecG [Syntrophales bacterium]HQG34508.1 preprotein translocase subunit SecG [Syntrophales bacterium]
MHTLIIILHIVICIALILVVLLQAGKGANMGAVFGGSSQTIFGSSGPGTFLGKMTTAIAVFFMLTSLGLSYMSVQKGSALMKGATGRPAAERPLPAAPSAPAAPEAQKSAPSLPAPAAKAPATTQPPVSEPGQKAR